MKKQIFILTFSFLAMVATTKTLQGQALAPRPLDASCAPASGPLTPYVGTLYDYTVEVPNNETWANVTYHWFVTQQTTFITGSTLTSNRVASGMLTSTSVYDKADNTSATIPITWTSTAAADGNPFYLVVYVAGDNGDCADIDNIKVYEIKPVKSFTLDIANVDSDFNILDTWDISTGRSPINELCVSDVESASYTNGAMVYDYGTNYLYYAITAANFGTFWDATFQLEGIATGQTVKVEWSRNADFSGLSEIIATTAIAVGTTGVYELNVPVVDAASTAAGETIYIRVTVDNGTFETLADQKWTFRVDGKDAGGNGDLHYVDCSVDQFANDWTEQIITPRPNVVNDDGNDVTSPGFLQP